MCRSPAHAIGMKWRPWFGLCVSAAVLAACAQHGATPNLPPAMVAARHVDSVSSSNGVTTVSGTIAAVKSSTEFEVNAGTGCGYLNIYTNSSTVFSPSGAQPSVGEYAVSSGSGGCATYLNASSVTLSSPSPTPSPSTSASPTPMPASYTVGYGEIFGADNAFSPNDGDTSAGGQGQTIDNMSCLSTMPGAYHVHSFVGIIINGRQLALPDGIGMKGPGADGTYDGIPNWTEYASCYYSIHTHDASGVLHVESAQSASPSTSLYTLGNAFDMWGMVLSSTQIGPYTGTVRAYVAQVPLKTAQILRTDYTLYSGDPASIPLRSHTTTWLEIGPSYVEPAALPVLNYYEEY